MKVLGYCFFLVSFIFLMTSFWGEDKLICLSMFDMIGLNVNLLFIFDKFSLIFCFIVGFVSGVVMIYSTFYMGVLWSNRFTYLVMLFAFSMMILIFSGNFFLILLGWDGLGITSFALVIYYQNEISVKSGLLTVFINRLGDSAMIFWICMFFMLGDSVDLLGILNNCNLKLGVILFFLGCFTKSAQFPFMSWLPAAMTAPTPVSSLVHSSTLVTAGVYLLLRFNYFLVEDFFFNLISFFGLLTMGVGGLLALMEVDFKKIIAFSTLSQLGLLVFVLSFGEKSICFFHLISHAIFKSFLFMICGVFMSSSFGVQDSRIMGIKLPGSAIFQIFIMFSCLNLSGIPLSLGFLSKDLILESFMGGMMSMFMLFFFFFFCCVTVCYSVKLFFLIMNYKKIGFSVLSFVLMEGGKLSLVFLSIILCSWGLLMEELLIEDDMYTFFQDFKIFDLLIFFFSYFIFSMSSYLKNVMFLISDYFWISFLFYFGGEKFYSFFLFYSFDLSFFTDLLLVGVWNSLFSKNFKIFFYLFNLKNFYYLNVLFLLYFVFFY